jgi:hypothetical protein
VAWPYILGTLGLVWLTALTVLLAALIRHVGALQLAVQAGGINSGESFDFDSDGPVVGSELSPQTVNLLEDAGIVPDDRSEWTAVFLSSSCVPCWERASEIVGRGEGLDRTVFLVTGANPKGLERLQTLFGQTDFHVLYDPAARDIVESLDIRSTPFAFRFTSKVTAKRYLRSSEDFPSLVQADVFTAQTAGSKG